MPVPTPVDHAVVAALIAVLPVYVAWEHRRLVCRVRAGVPDARARDYRSTMIAQWAVTAGIVALWWRTGRPADLLGFALPGGMRLFVGATVTALGLAFLHAQWRAAMRLDRTGLDGLRAQMESVVDFLPRTPSEASLFRGLSVTAGICEEIVYRGYLIWYLAGFVDVWPGAALAAVAFGASHMYQGVAGAIRAGLIGLVTGALYVGTGSLLWPMILHVAIDLQGGALARRALEPARGG